MEQVLICDSLSSRFFSVFVLFFFSVQDDFLKMIPGMSRRMAEHREGLLTEIDHHRGVEAPLLKSGNGNGSFGHHVMATDETLYSLESARGPMVTSQSINSVVGIASQHITPTSHSSRNVPEGAEVGPVTADIERRSPMASTMSRMQQQQHHQSFLFNNSPTMHSTTLPRLLEKRNSHQHQHQQHHQYQQQVYHPQQQQQHQQHHQMPRHYVVATNGLSDDVEMDRTSFMNGDDDDDDSNVKEVPPSSRSLSHQHHNLVKVIVPPPPRLDFVIPEGVPPPPPSSSSSMTSSAATTVPSSTSSFMPPPPVTATTTMPRNVNGGIITSGNGTCGRKKKSVTIGTFTTVETFIPNPGDESV